MRIELFERGEYPALKNCRVFIRRRLVELYGERCMRCGWAERNPVTERVPLDIEHVDGDWTNNTPSNLALLCPNCHSLTPTYKGLNRGRGREYRMEAYERRRGSVATARTL